MPRVNFETSSSLRLHNASNCFPFFRIVLQCVSRCFTLFHCCGKNQANLVHATVETPRVSEFKIAGSLVECCGFGKSYMIDGLTTTCQPSPRCISVHPHNDRGTGIAAAELAMMAGTASSSWRLVAPGPCDLRQALTE